MRLVAFLFMFALAFPASAAEPDVPFHSLWRSDAALTEAGKLIRDKKYSAAILVLDKIVQRNIRNADAHVYTAIAWANLGDLQKAKNALTNAFAIDKGHMGAYLVGGVIAIQEKAWEQAEYYLGAIKTVCQSEQCLEYRVLRKAIIEADK